MLGASPFGVPVTWPDQVKVVRPALRLGFGVMTRVATEASRGMTWYFAASSQKSLSISFTLSGYWSATLLASVQSCSTSYNSYGKPAGSWLTAPATSQGGRMTFVLAIQPS